MNNLEFLHAFLFLKSASSKLFNTTIKNIILYFKKNRITFKKNYEPKINKYFCLLRSPHGDKDSREHLQLVFYKIVFHILFKTVKQLNYMLNIRIPNIITYTMQYFLP